MTTKSPFSQFCERPQKLFFLNSEPRVTFTVTVDEYSHDVNEVFLQIKYVVLITLKAEPFGRFQAHMEPTARFLTTILTHPIYRYSCQQCKSSVLEIHIL